MATDSSTIKKEKILIIGSNSSLNESIANTLRAENYIVFQVGNGADGMKIILDILPNLIILDLAVSGGDAYEILENKQAEPLLAKIPVFLLSTQGVPINMRRVPKKSVIEFIMSLEPDMVNLVHMIDLRLHHSSDELKISNADGGIPTSAIKKKILWVEDDKLIGSILEKKFTSSGFNLVHVKNSEEAFRQLANIVPDVIILDLLLTGMSGFDILKNIRSMGGKLAEVPVMILSNLSNQSDIERAKILGASKFMVKAASSLDQIVAEVRTLVS